MLVHCDYCGTEIDKPANYINQSRKRNQKIYCSRECRYKAHRFKCHCGYCNKEIWKTASELRNSKSGELFCSKSCACAYNNTMLRSQENNPNWIDGNSTKGNEYIKLAFRYYINKCAICGLEENCCLQVHHIDENRANNALENLIIVCANCHSRIHRGGLRITDLIKNNREYKSTF